MDEDFFLLAWLMFSDFVFCGYCSSRFVNCSYRSGTGLHIRAKISRNHSFKLIVSGFSCYLKDGTLNKNYLKWTFIIKYFIHETLDPEMFFSKVLF